MKILENNSVIEIDGQKYRIPEYYNKDMIAEGDTKTIEMVAISVMYKPDRYLIKD